MELEKARQYQSVAYQSVAAPAPTVGRRDLITPNPKLKLLDQVREVMRLKHYSIRTETSYCEWIRRYVKFHNMQSRADLQPGEEKRELFLSDLAGPGQVAASTQNQAFSALLFLYREVLHYELGRVNALRAGGQWFEEPAGLSVRREGSQDLREGGKGPARSILRRIQPFCSRLFPRSSPAGTAWAPVCNLSLVPPSPRPTHTVAPLQSLQRCDGVCRERPRRGTRQPR